jgi:HPt (histidine-containing phosphotransfer) domain-containing protein
VTDPARDRPPIDFGSLVQRCMGDPRFAQAMLAMFAQQAPPMVRDLRSHLAAGDVARAASVAHALKGSAANVSAQPLSEAAAAIEDRCRAGDMGTMPDAMARLDEAMQRCLACADAMASTEPA